MKPGRRWDISECDSEYSIHNKCMPRKTKTLKTFLVVTTTGKTGSNGRKNRPVVPEREIEINALGVHYLSLTIPVRHIVFRADHPFIFLILDTQTKAVLFAGRHSDPAA
uniref:Serpin n=1 Tax=Locusta migratoria migratoria TaxID=238695 RepID=A0A4Y1PUG5_LOCMI|nr:serpin [Locusta migratoria migratoria]